MEVSECLLGRFSSICPGVSVLGLGALNKAEFINRGGEDILHAFKPRKTR